MKKAPSLGADTLVFDLEDGVAPSAKPEARRSIASFLKTHSGEKLRSELFVRINAVGRGGLEQ